MKYYAYENFREDTRKLLEQIKAFQPEMIVGIARGGLSLSHALAEGLNIRDVQTLRTELYDESEKRDAITIHNNCVFEHIKRVLVVDDIADSGDTLKAVMSELLEKNSKIEFRSCTLFYKRTSVYEPHYWINEADDWIDFFWERDFNL